MSAYTTAVLADSPTHYYRLSELGGPFIADFGSSPRPGYVSGTSTAPGFTGPVSDGGSCYFFGSRFETALNTLVFTPPYSADLWVYLARQNVAMEFLDFGMQLEVDATGHVLGATPGSGLVSTTLIPIEAWHHIGMEGHTGGRTLYFDGAAVSFDNVTPASATQEIAIGSTHTGIAPTTAFLAEVAIYPTALSAARFAAHHAAADNVPSTPTYRPLGTSSTQPGGFTSDADLIQKVIAAVTHTFPTT